MKFFNKLDKDVVITTLISIFIYIISLFNLLIIERTFGLTYLGIFAFFLLVIEVISSIVVLGSDVYIIKNFSKIKFDYLIYNIYQIYLRNFFLNLFFLVLFFLIYSNNYYLKQLTDNFTSAINVSLIDFILLCLLYSYNKIYLTVLRSKQYFYKFNFYNFIEKFFFLILLISISLLNLDQNIIKIYMYVIIIQSFLFLYDFLILSKKSLNKKKIIDKYGEYTYINLKYFIINFLLDIGKKIPGFFLYNINVDHFAVYSLIIRFSNPVLFIQKVITLIFAPKLGKNIIKINHGTLASLKKNILSISFLILAYGVLFLPIIFYTIELDVKNYSISVIFTLVFICLISTYFSFITGPFVIYLNINNKEFFSFILAIFYLTISFIISYLFRNSITYSISILIYSLSLIAISLLSQFVLKKINLKYTAIWLKK